MIGALYRPLGLERSLLVAAGLMAATALYCLSYNALAGRTESLGEGLLWALVNVVPFYLAFEAAKGKSAGAAAAALAAAVAASMLLQMLAHGAAPDWGFELVRRVPSLFLAAVLLASGGLVASSKYVSLPARPGSLPVPPDDVDWISAAGNYVELRGKGRTLLVRTPISRVHGELERHGFVRIHRSTLVRRERIARVRPTDVVLHDGTSLKTGKRYRSTLH